MTAKRKTPAKPSLAAVARETNIARETLRAWQAQGVNIHDRRELLQRAEIRKTTHSGELGQLKAEKLKLECERLRAAIDREEGRTIDLCQAEALFARIGAELRARLLSWRGTLVPELHGLDEPGIYSVLTHRIDELLEMISSNNPATHDFH
jgi:DNA-binding transcriptional MerR regulator